MIKKKRAEAQKLGSIHIPLRIGDESRAGRRGRSASHVAGGTSHNGGGRGRGKAHAGWNGMATLRRTEERGKQRETGDCSGGKCCGRQEPHDERLHSVAETCGSAGDGSCRRGGWFLTKRPAVKRRGKG